MFLCVCVCVQNIAYQAHFLCLELACFSLFSFCLVLTAAVTQASLQSMLHKILTAGPSAFNITTILSQAAQLSSQGKRNLRKAAQIMSIIFVAFGTACCCHKDPCNIFCCFITFVYHTWYCNTSHCLFVCSVFSSSAVKPVTDVVNIRCIITQILCFSSHRHATSHCWSPQTSTQHPAGHLAVKGREIR